MSKRRISKQQSARIKQIQQTYQKNKEHQKGLSNGLVITQFGKQVTLEDQEGLLVHCSIRPNLETLVAGDQVVWQSEGCNQGVVVSLYPRNSILAKPTFVGSIKPIAANISQLIIVISPKPEVSWPLLDSYLVMAEILNLPALILLNKIDLPCTLIKEQLLANYQNLNYPILFFRKNSLEHREQLTKILNHQTSVFVGQSGVGKSSLISALLPHECIAIGELSERSNLGKHTTSNSRYYHLPGGGALIDSPGIREFSLWQISKAEIAHAYIEFRPYLSQCQFRNCTHKETALCAIIKAVEEGSISEHRYKNFIKLCTQYGKSP
jgi:ribosome biogenesis GTPase